MELIDEILDNNDKILKNNAELIAVNKEWSKLTKQLLDMLMEERRKRANGEKEDVPETNVGKMVDTISRQPVELIPLPSVQLATDTNVGTKLSTNLAEVGTDCISRRAAIDAVEESRRLNHHKDGKEACAHEYEHRHFLKLLMDLPPTQSEIIYCKDCAKHNKGLGNYEVHPDGSSTWIWKDSACPLVSWRGKAQGHEYDYQYCVYAERKVTECLD